MGAGAGFRRPFSLARVGGDSVPRAACSGRSGPLAGAEASWMRPRQYRHDPVRDLGGLSSPAPAKGLWAQSRGCSCSLPAAAGRCSGCPLCTSSPPNAETRALCRGCRFTEQRRFTQLLLRTRRSFLARTPWLQRAAGSSRPTLTRRLSES